MIYYKPTDRLFKSRAEAKAYLGAAYYQRLVKTRDKDLLFLNDDFIARYELQKSNRENKRETKTAGGLYISGATV